MPTKGTFSASRPIRRDWDSAFCRHDAGNSGRIRIELYKELPAPWLLLERGRSSIILPDSSGSGIVNMACGRAAAISPSQ